jgi:hypothetical protein
MRRRRISDSAAIRISMRASWLKLLVNFSMRKLMQQCEDMFCSSMRTIRLAPRYVCVCIRQHTSAYVSIRQHTSAYTRQHTFWFLNRNQKPHVARHKNARAHIVHEPHNFTALLAHNDGRSILCLGDRVWKKYTKGKKTGFQKKKRHTTQNKMYVMLKDLSAYCTS